MGYSLVPGQVWTGSNIAGDVSINVTGLTAGNVLLVFVGENPNGAQGLPTSANTVFSQITLKAQSGLAEAVMYRGLIGSSGSDTILVHPPNSNTVLVVVAEFTGNSQIMGSLPHGTVTNGALSNSVSLDAVVAATGELALGVAVTAGAALSSTSQTSLADVSQNGFLMNVSYSLSGASTTFTWSSTGASVFATIGTALKVPHIPTAPSNLVATANGSTEIDLTWQDNSSDEANFILQRGPDGSSWSTVATPAFNAVSYNDTPLSAGTKYYYQIAATNADGTSSYSSPANATTNGSSAQTTNEQNALKFFLGV